MGPIIALAALAFVPGPGGFASARHFAAWIGRMPKVPSNGGKARLRRIPKLGHAELRPVLTGRATSALRHVRDREQVWPWRKEMLARRSFKVVAVAPANRIARTIWALLTAGGTYRAPTPTEVATMPG